MEAVRARGNLGSLYDSSYKEALFAFQNPQPVRHFIQTRRKALPRRHVCTINRTNRIIRTGEPFPHTFDAQRPTLPARATAPFTIIPNHRATYRTRPRARNHMSTRFNGHFASSHRPLALAKPLHSPHLAAAHTSHGTCRRAASAPRDCPAPRSRRDPVRESDPPRESSTTGAR